MQQINVKNGLESTLLQGILDKESYEIISNFKWIFFLDFYVINNRKYLNLLVLFLLKNMSFRERV